MNQKGEKITSWVCLITALARQQPSFVLQVGQELMYNNVDCLYSVQQCPSSIWHLLSENRSLCLVFDCFRHPI